MKDFDTIIKQLLKHEGEYVNDSTDSGGETKYGISKRSFPTIDIKKLTLYDAEEIYYKEYWLKGKCNKVPEHLRHIYFDMCVNFGISGAVKVLQRAANNKKAKLYVDGQIGPKTLSAIKKLEVERVRSYRILKFASIVLRKKSQEKFWYGWFKRSLEV